MRDTMAHRGPDGAGIWLSGDGRIGLGHRRLSIIDLSARLRSRCRNEDASLWVSFNGEIYNHAELRRELESTGEHRWKTDHSDTEAILHALRAVGYRLSRPLPRHVRVCSLGRTDRELWLVRDRIGVKPLYYSVHQGAHVRVGDQGAARRSRHPRDVDEEAFYHYLSFLTTPAPSTLFEGIRKLLPEHGCTCRSGQIRFRRYWDVLWTAREPLVRV